jgi:thioredoxin 1
MMSEPAREEIDRLPGPLVLEFGAEWCPHCQAIQPQMRALLQKFPQVRHIKVEDGRGKQLGRSFRVKLWPNLVFMRDGEVLLQLARPSAVEVQAGFELLGMV